MLTCPLVRGSQSNRTRWKLTAWKMLCGTATAGRRNGSRLLCSSPACLCKQ